MAALLLDPPPSLRSILSQTALPDPTSVCDLEHEGSSLSASEASFQVCVREELVLLGCCSLLPSAAVAVMQPQLHPPAIHSLWCAQSARPPLYSPPLATV